MQKGFFKVNFHLLMQKEESFSNRFLNTHFDLTQIWAEVHNFILKQELFCKSQTQKQATITEIATYESHFWLQN